MTTFRASRNSPEALQEKFDSKGNFQKKFAKKKKEKDMIREDLEPQPEAKKSFRDTLREEEPKMFAEKVDKEVRKFIQTNLTDLSLSEADLNKAVDDSMNLIYGSIGSPYMSTNPSAWKSQALFSVENSISDTILNTNNSIVSGLADYYRQLIITQQGKIKMNATTNNTQANNATTEMPHISVTPTVGVEEVQDAVIKKETTHSAINTAVDAVIAKANAAGAPVDEVAVRSAFAKLGAMAEEAAASGHTAQDIERVVMMMAEAAEIAEANQAQPQRVADKLIDEVLGELSPEEKEQYRQKGNKTAPQPTPEPPPQPQPQQAKAAAPKVEEGYSTLQKAAMWVGGAIAVGVVGYGIYRLVKSGDVETAAKTADVLGNVSAAAASALSDFA